MHLPLIFRHQKIKNIRLMSLFLPPRSGRKDSGVVQKGAVVAQVVFVDFFLRDFLAFFVRKIKEIDASFLVAGEKRVAKIVEF